MQWFLFKGTTRVKFSNSHNLWKPHGNSVYIGYRQPKTYIHMKDMVLARGCTALLEAACAIMAWNVCQLVRKAASKPDIIYAGEENIY